MNKIPPFSALYYIKENKGRVSICMFMMLLASMLFLAGNYIYTPIHSFEKEFEYSDQLVVAGIQSTDEEYKDWYQFREKIIQDDRLDCVDVSAYGFSGMQHGTVLNLDMRGMAYVFNSKEDMEKVFEHLGIEGDFSNCKNNSMIISKNTADNKGIRLGDTLDHSFDSNIDGTYTVDAIINDGSYCSFYIYKSDDNLGRLYIFSDDMKGTELYNYVNHLAEGLNVQISESEKNMLMPQFSAFYMIFYLLDILVAIVLAVTVNSVVTGHYAKRTFEFGIYKAIGIGKKEIRKKVIAEIIIINLISCVIGFSLIFLFTYLINEQMYKNQGMRLVFYSDIGIIGFLICDAMIVIPLILSKGAKMSRADITSF